MPERRKRIPSSVAVAVLTEAGYRCAVPTCRQILALDLHHLVRVADGGTSTPDNLIALCPTCHALHTRGEISADSIAVWKGVLVSLTRAFDRQAIDNLLFVAHLRGVSPRLNFSAGDILKFAPLIAAGVVEFYHPCWDSEPEVVGYDTYRLRLTEAGAAFVQAWKAGDRTALKCALAGPVAPTAGRDDPHA